MPYRCVNCSEIYGDGSKEVLQGCSNCGSKFFFYIKEDKLKEILSGSEDMPDLGQAEIERIEKDVRQIAGITDVDKPVFLDFESVKVLKTGKYLLDLTKLFSLNKPRVYQIEDGKYIIDLSAINKDNKERKKIE